MTHDLAQALIDVGGWTLVFVATVTCAAMALKGIRAAAMLCLGVLIRKGVIE